MPATLSERISKLSEEVDTISAQIKEGKVDEIDRELKAVQIYQANQTNNISDIKSQLTILSKDFDEFKRTLSKDIEDLKRELISYIILSNASKELDTVKLAESAGHLASGITPGSVS